MQQYADSPQPAAMIVRPNGNIQRFTAQHHPGFRYLGTVQRELQIGALARTPAGHYVQVNGSFIETLDKTEVENALRAAGVLPAAAPAPAAPAAPTVIIRRKRRLLEQPASTRDERVVP